MGAVCRFVLGVFVMSAALAPAQEEKKPGKKEKSPEKLFEDVAEATGLKGQGAFRVAFVRLNGDEYPDLVLNKTLHYFSEGSGKKRKFVRSKHDGVLQPEGVRGADFCQYGDVDNDGDLDIFCGRGTDLSKKDFKDDGLRSEIWLNDGKGKFTLQKDSGVGAHAETSSSACFMDVDRDGILDLFVGNAYVEYGTSYRAFPDRLYLGKGDGTFAEVTEQAGLLGTDEVGVREGRRPTYGVTHTDWNNDGWQDLLVCTYGRQWNRLWKNNGDGTFTDVGEETTFDGDEIRDGVYPEWAQKNFEKTEKRRRSDEPEFRANGNTFDCAVADYDGDGDMDCFFGEIHHAWGGDSSDSSMLLINLGEKEGYTFRRAPEMIQRVHGDPVNWNEGDLHVGWMDVENDGRLDLLIASTDYPDLQILRLYRQKEDGTFEEWTDRLGFTWEHATQISLADYDRDGATDIVIGKGKHRMTAEQAERHTWDMGIYRNIAAAAAGNRFFNLRLTGSGKSNRDALGARVTIWIGEQRQTRELYGGLGHSGHRDDTECRFGVGTAKKIDRMEVRWPDAKVTVEEFTNIETNGFYTLQQGGKLKKPK